MTSPPQRPLSPIGQAMEWVAKITTVALEMVLPGLAGQWLDKKLGTGFLVLIGFGLGLTTGMMHLLFMTGAWSGKAKDKSPDQSGVERRGASTLPGEPPTPPRRSDVDRKSGPHADERNDDVP